MKEEFDLFFSICSNGRDARLLSPSIRLSPLAFPEEDECILPIGAFLFSTFEF